jgi:hypothetical protein
MTRHVVFNHKVRKAFFRDVQNAGRPKRHVPLTQQGFRSAAMDTWLLEEYLYRNHDPPSRDALNRGPPCLHDPLDVGASAEACRSTFMD